MSAPAAWFYDARTAHVRYAPAKRAFAYRLFQLYLDIDRIGEAQTALFSYNRANLFSFFDRDHGDRSGARLRSWAETMFREAGVDLEGGPIRLLTFPRMLHYVFNPLSIFFGFDRTGSLKGVIYEVNNTFGETHAYVFAVGADGPLYRHAAPKSFHVSPFLDVHGAYRFAVRAPDETFALVVDNWADGVLEHRASLSGRRRVLSDARLILAFLTLPLMTFGVTAAIHWQAAKIWLAKIAYRPKPAPPTPSFTTTACPETVARAAKMG